MGILGWLLLAALCVICCGYFNSKKSDLWGLKGVAAGAAAFVLLWVVLPILWGLVKVVAIVAILGALAGIGYLVFKAVAKHA